MKEILDFYLQLSQNNNKPWFDAHRAEYEVIKKKTTALAEEFIKGVDNENREIRVTLPKGLLEL